MFTNNKYLIYDFKSDSFFLLFKETLGLFKALYKSSLLLFINKLVGRVSL